MRFNLQVRGKAHTFMPYVTHKRRYYLLFKFFVGLHEPIYVQDVDFSVPDTFFSVGKMTIFGYDGPECGKILFTTYHTLTYGTSVLAYKASSLRLPSVALSQSVPKPPDSRLVLRTPELHLYHSKDNHTLAVSPIISTRIRDNLET